MALVDIVMPRMGESIHEATILEWNKQPGDHVDEDETICLTQTDKVDSEIPSHVEGTLKEILFPEGEVVAVGTVIARIEVEGAEGEQAGSSTTAVATPASTGSTVKATPTPATAGSNGNVAVITPAVAADTTTATRFYSPLVKSIAKTEQISMAELEALTGSGANGRVTKKDILGYLQNRTGTPAVSTNGIKHQTSTSNQIANQPASSGQLKATSGQNVEIIEMDRMRKLIADHMVRSKQTSPHVTSFVEADVTNLFNWRNKVKKEYQQKYGERITFTPIFVEAVVKAIKDFPMVNVSIDGDKIIKKNFINIGIATALPSGNLIVPVIKNSEFMNLHGLTKSANDLIARARENKLKPDDIQNGTFTLTNVGTFGNLSGTPIINQPQVAILATGAIKKKPAVIETEYGDVIAVRQLMMMSLSYDHRVVDGFLGGSFLRRVADYLEQFDHNQTI